MMYEFFRILFRLAVLASFVVPASAQGLPEWPKRSPADDSLKLLKTPMVFYVARGEQDACGAGCSEWIAAEGTFDPGAAKRFRAFLSRSGVARLPVYFSSPGGLVERAVEMGRLMRERRMTAGVSRTVPEGCKGVDEKKCQALKQSDQRLTAELKTLTACNSACVYALMGAAERQVPPGAQLGVHASKAIRIFSDGRVETSPKRMASDFDTRMNAQLQKYLKDMGIDLRLLEIASKTPHEGVYYLTRDEIASMGIDRRPFLETRWSEQAVKGASIIKLFVDSPSAERGERRLSIVNMRCARPGQIAIMYFRAQRPGENAASRRVNIAINDRYVLMSVLNRPPLDLALGGLFDVWYTFQPLDFLESVAKRESIELVVSESVVSTLSPAHRTTLSTAGLARTIGSFRDDQRCSVATENGGWAQRPPVPAPSNGGPVENALPNGGWVVAPVKK